MVLWAPVLRHSVASEKIILDWGRKVNASKKEAAWVLSQDWLQAKLYTEWNWVTADYWSVSISWEAVKEMHQDLWLKYDETYLFHYHPAEINSYGWWSLNRSGADKATDKKNYINHQKDQSQIGQFDALTWWVLFVSHDTTQENALSQQSFHWRLQDIVLCFWDNTELNKYLEVWGMEDLDLPQILLFRAEVKQALDNDWLTIVDVMNVIKQWGNIYHLRVKLKDAIAGRNATQGDLQIAPSEARKIVSWSQEAWINQQWWISLDTQRKEGQYALDNNLLSEQALQRRKNLQVSKNEQMKLADSLIDQL